jgi:HK97 family phage major capsid protein
MRAQLEEMKSEAKNLITNDSATVDMIKAKQSEIEAFKAKIEMAEQLEAEEREIMNRTQAVPVVATGTPVNQEKAYSDAFYNALRGKGISAEQRELLIKNSLSSSVGEDGGYIIPTDQQTAIKEIKRELSALETLVNVEPVTTLAGSRNIEKDAEFTPFSVFSEGDTLADTDSPQFVNIAYTIKDRGGILPVPNNLLADNSANLSGYLNRWLAKKEVATRNDLIVTLLNTLSKTAIADINDVKTAMNVTLDPAIAAMSTVIMNQDSFNKFDQMVDLDGRPLLMPDPTQPTRKMLAGRPVAVFSNRIIPTRSETVGEVTTNYAPVIIGSLKEAVTLFDRQAISLLATNVGGTSFTKNRTEIRAITREDVALVDSSAVVFGEIVIA